MWRAIRPDAPDACISRSRKGSGPDSRRVRGDAASFAIQVREMDWTAWQLCDSAFPAGALAHSGGLEAAWQQGEVMGPEGAVEWGMTILRQAGRSALPFVAAGWSHAIPLREADARCDAFLLNHVANQASRALGQAMLMACVRAFGSDGVARLADEVRTQNMAAHHAPVFGALGRALGLSRRSTGELFLYLSLRAVMSAAVRLGIIGPFVAQGIQHEMASRVQPCVDRWLDFELHDAAQTAPLADVLQGTQERLYSRLFVS